MKLVVLPLTLLGLLCVASADALRDQVNSTNVAVCKAMQTKDMDAFAKILRPITSPKFTYTEPGFPKPMTFDQMVNNMKMGLSQMTRITYVNSHMLNAKIKGNSAVVSNVHKMTGGVLDKNKKSHTLSYTLVSSDTYELQGGKWMWTSMTVKTSEGKMDGKPMPPMQPMKSSTN